MTILKFKAKIKKAFGFKHYGSYICKSCGHVWLSPLATEQLCPNCHSVWVVLMENSIKESPPAKP